MIVQHFGADCKICCKTKSSTGLCGEILIWIKSGKIEVKYLATTKRQLMNKRPVTNALLHTAAWILIMVRPVFAQAGEPTLGTAEFQDRGTLPWYVGALIFLAIMVGVTVWKRWIAKNSKKQVIQTNCCAPLIDEDAHPFRPSDDSPSEKA